MDTRASSKIIIPKKIVFSEKFQKKFSIYSFFFAIFEILNSSKNPLGIESIPLVERIFADLIHTTEALKKARLRSKNDSSQTINSTVNTGKGK